MNDSSRRYLVAYDIRDDKRRLKTANCLQSYGYRVQYSIFLVELKPARLERLCSQVSEMILEKEDAVLICDLGLVKTSRYHNIRYLGKHGHFDEHDSVVI